MYVRKGNIKFVVVQDNLGKTLKIESIQKPKDDQNPAYGYDESDLIGNDFSKIVSEDVNESLEDYIEYDFSGADFKDVCDKIIKFEVVDAQNKTHEMNAHIERDVSMPERQVFMILLEKRLYLHDRIKAVMNAIPPEARQDESTGFLSRNTYMNVLDAVMDFLDENRSITGMLYVFRIDNYDELERTHGGAKVMQLVTEVSNSAKKGFRTRDIIGYLGNGVFSAILLRIEDAEALIPIRRFESKLRAAMIPAVTGVSINVINTYGNIDLEMESRALVEKCKQSKKLYEIKL